MRERDSKAKRLGMSDSLVTRSSEPGEGCGEDMGTKSGRASGQLQELLQRVLLHSLHKELIVLGAGDEYVVTQRTPVLCPSRQQSCPNTPHAQSPDPYPTILVPIDNLRWGGLGVARQGPHLVPQGVVLGDVH